jgi:hypothetical protein
VNDNIPASAEDRYTFGVVLLVTSQNSHKFNMSTGLKSKMATLEKSVVYII